MKRKYKYSLVIFSHCDKSISETNICFLSRAFARKEQKAISKTLEKHLSCRIVQYEIIPKVFNQTTIYDFGA